MIHCTILLNKASVCVAGAVWFKKKKNTAIFKSSPILITLIQRLNHLRLNQKWFLRCVNTQLTQSTRQAGQHTTPSASWTGIAKPAMSKHFL